MATSTLENGMITPLTEKVFTFGLMEEFMLVNGSKT
jgi:hypothetical protein